MPVSEPSHEWLDRSWVTQLAECQEHIVTGGTIPIVQRGSQWVPGAMIAQCAKLNGGEPTYLGIRRAGRRIGRRPRL